MCKYIMYVLVLRVSEVQLQAVFCAFYKTCPPMTLLCEKIISILPSWRKMNGPNQLMSLQQFVYDVQEQLNPLANEDDLRHIAQQLHSIGEVSAFYLNYVFLLSRYFSGHIA